MPRTYHEKSTFLSALSLLIGSAVYLALAPIDGGPDVDARHVVIAALACAAVAIFQAVTQAVVVLRAGRSDLDERDKEITRTGGTVGGGALAVVVFAALWTAAATDGNLRTAQVLLGGWVLAQLLEYGVILALYQRGR